VSEETEEDKETKKDLREDIFGRAMREPTSVERDLAGLGISPVQVRVNEGDKLEVKRAYMGLAVSYAGKQEAIPVVQDTAGLEYDLTTLIRKLARDKRAKVALVTGQGEPDPARELGGAYGLLTQLYDVTPLDMSQTTEVPEDVTALVIAGPTKPFSEAAQRGIDAFLARGGAAAFLLDTVKPDLQTLQTQDAEHGLGPLLASYGVNIRPGLVLDAESATIAVARQRGFMRIQEPVRYPFLPQPRTLDPDSPLTRGLSQVVFPFISPVEVTSTAPGVEVAVLVRSSADSWVHEPPYDLNPFRRWTQDDVGEQGARNLVVALSGTLPRHFPTEGEAAAQPSRIVVAGGASFIGDQFFSEGNKALFLNLMDWLVRDDALLAIRTRGLRAAPLGELSDSTRSLLKYGNVVGVPLLLILFGLLRWARRESRRATAAIA